jgi:hypothetical protein
MPQRLGLTATGVAPQHIVRVSHGPTVATNTALGAPALSASASTAGPSFDDEVEIAEDRHLID